MGEKQVRYDSVQALLKKTFSMLDDATLQQLFAESEVIASTSGEIILHQHQNNPGLVVLLDGILTVELPSKTQNHIVHFIQKGEVFYANESFLSLKNQSFCSALIASTILLIPSTVLKNICATNPAFILQLLTWGCAEKSIFEQHAANLLGLSVKLRFINALKTLGAKFSENNYLPIQPLVIGNFILASKSSLFRTLSELEKEKIIRTDKNGIRILQNKYLETF